MHGSNDSFSTATPTSSPSCPAAIFSYYFIVIVLVALTCLLPAAILAAWCCLGHSTSWSSHRTPDHPRAAGRGPHSVRWQPDFPLPLLVAIDSEGQDINFTRKA
jgi:hypothetical protein